MPPQGRFPFGFVDGRNAFGTEDRLSRFDLSQRDREALRACCSAGRVYYAPSLPISAQAYLALAVFHEFRRSLIWVVDNPQTLDMAFHDLSALMGERVVNVSFFPAREPSPIRGGAPHPDLVGDRLLTLQQCAASREPRIIVTCIQALLQPTPPPDQLRAQSLELCVGDNTDPEHIVEACLTLGYRVEVEVTEKRQIARHGGILDVWPVTEPWPVRVEFVGSTIESMRTFDPRDQRSREKRTSMLVTPTDEIPAAEPVEPLASGRRSYTLADYVPPDTLWVWTEPESIHHHAELYRSLIPEEDPSRTAMLDFYSFRQMLRNRRFGGEICIGWDAAMEGAAVPLDLRAGESMPALRGETPRPDLLESERERLIDRLVEQHKAGIAVYLFFATSGARDRFLEIHPACKGMFSRLAPLSEGFSCESLGFVVVSESDLYGVRKALPGRYERHGRRPGPSVTPGERLTDWTDIQPGELVVHIEHGIGKYLGLYEIEFDGRLQEVLAVEYANKARLYVPVSQAHLLSRYVGVGHRRPELHVLGGRRWRREKEAAEKAIQDFAATLLETQARRETMEGHAFAPDTPWQHEFEAAFPYQETADQLCAITEVKADMESPKPMDRLVCGDVGYGKTEIAMRAAFKAVMDGRQVAILVPTTVLAQQHFDTFTERMAAFPVSIEMLSRFRSHAQQADIVKRLAEGAVDIVIGTHRLLQPDIRFADLGLVIIDEEQRFGVAHKEHFKRLRAMVDVLTLTATPIPRTLYLSMTGARDLSIIQTPPQDRLPVETIVAQYSDELVRQAILRELNRGGQVYYLHNRVTTIEAVHQHLQNIVPEARVVVAHGQMKESHLARVMHEFVRHRYDVLLCTTIIESGVDIPNVNTILIDRADRFGMADLYQLRGRVGRYKHRAYAYLLLPRHGHLFYDARRRIAAIQAHSSLGAGFRLALRDLEIRGAGNLLGREQSGHVAAVGFELYCQLLRRSVARLKNEPLPPIVDVRLKLDFIETSPSPAAADQAAVIPSQYVEDESLRVSLYRRLAAAVSMEEVEQFERELRDRFGDLPEPLRRLLLIARIRIAAAQSKISEIEVREDKVMIMRGGDYIMPGGRFPRLKAKNATKRLEELLNWISRLGPR